MASVANCSIAAEGTASESFDCLSPGSTSLDCFLGADQRVLAASSASAAGSIFQFFLNVSLVSWVNQNPFDYLIQSFSH